MAEGNSTEDNAGEVLCTQQLDNLLIKYSIRAPEKAGKDDEVTQGSGANDVVEVREIQILRSGGDKNIATKTKRNGALQAEGESEDLGMGANDGIDGPSTPQKIENAREGDDASESRDNSGPPKEFGALKNYWAVRGEAHTPKGLSPSKSAEKIRAEKTGDRAFTFSNRRTLTPPNLTGLSAVGERNANET